jgi:hypothetical protein
MMVPALVVAWRVVGGFFEGRGEGNGKDRPGRYFYAVETLSDFGDSRISSDRSRKTDDSSPREQTGVDIY